MGWGNNKYKAKSRKEYEIAYRLDHKKEHKKYMKNYMLKKTYGISFEKYNKLLLEQGLCCRICSEILEKRRTDIDHSHETGEVRGILCHACNVGLGMFKDNISILKAAIKYLKEFDNGKSKEQFA